jgi:hypothetical protein
VEPEDEREHKDDFLDEHDNVEVFDDALLLVLESFQKRANLLVDTLFRLAYAASYGHRYLVNDNHLDCQHYHAEH